jgi:phosphoglycerol transferase MdoB-like AlkP superfamily enzyme
MTIHVHQAQATLQRGDLLSLGAFVGPSLAATLALKVYQFVHLDLALGGAWGALALFGGELLFALLWASLALWAARIPAKPLRWAGLGVSWLLTAAQLALSLIDAVFLARTGSTVDAYMLTYAWTERAQLGEVIATEVPLWGWILLGVFPLLAGSPLLLRSERLWGKLNRELWVPHLKPRALHAAFAGVACAAALLMLGLFRLDDPHAQALRGPALLTILEQGGAQAEDAMAGLGAVKITQTTISPRSDAKRWNVVFLVLESTRYSATTLADPKLASTPYLAELARTKGRPALSAYTVVPHTSKALVPIHCGVPPRIDTPISESYPGNLPTTCLPALLSGQGYKTAFFQTADRDFENRAGLVHSFGFGHFESKESVGRPPFEESSYFGFEDDAMLDPAFEWIDAHKGGPFMATFLTLTSHHNYKVPKSLKPEKLHDDKDYNNYLNTLRYGDRFTRELFARFEARGLLDQTIFIILGDHGEGFGEHKSFQHDNTIWDEGTHIPLVVIAPGLKDIGEPIEGLRQQMDVSTTVLDLLGYDLHSDVWEGKSLLGPGHEAIYLACWYRDRCLARLAGGRKELFLRSPTRTEVYDLQADPLDKTPITGKVPSAELAKHQREAQGWKARVNKLYDSQAALLRDKWISDTPTTPQVKMDVLFDGRIRLRGVNQAKLVARQGEAFELSYHFEALRGDMKSVGLFVHLLDAKGKVWRNLDHTPVQGTYPVDQWKEGQFIVDPQRVWLPKRIPPGEYRIAIGFWDRTVKGEVPSRLLPSGSGATFDDKRRATVATLTITK